MSFLICMWPWVRKSLGQMSASYGAPKNFFKKSQVRFPEASCWCLQVTMSFSLSCGSFCGCLSTHGQ